MARYLGWLANSVCFVLCCFFAASTVNAVIGASLSAASEEPVAPTERVALAVPTWTDRQVIVDRNLFNASLLAPVPSEAEIQENLEATRLPLTLLGTVASYEPANSWASIEERDTHVTRVVRVNDEIRPGATVLRIERRRVVLMENGAQRELALAEDDPALGGPGGPAALSRRRAAVPPRRAGASPGAFPGGTPTDPSQAANDDPASLRNPATLFSQARILPKYENGAMVGVQVSAIKPGSLFESIGIKNGCVIKELNGIKIDSPEQSAKILLEFVDAKRFDIVVDECQGTQNLSYTPRG